MDEHATRGAARNARWPLVCGAVTGPLFVVTFLILGATRPEYNPLRHPVSSLALGDTGWMQIVNFIVTGSLLLAFAGGLWRTPRIGGGSTWGPLLLGLVGLGLIGAGIFTADPRSGYPPGTADQPLTATTTGQLHDLFSTPVFVGLPAACFVFRRWFVTIGERGWAIYSVVSGLGMLTAFFISSLGFGQVAGIVAYGGLFQRIALMIGLGWVTLLALYQVRVVGTEPESRDIRRLAD